MPPRSAASVAMQTVMLTWALVLTQAGLWPGAPAVASTWTQDPHIREHHHTAWTVQRGAPGQITALAQSPDGYLWLATQSGVFRFDGMAFEHVLPAPQPFPSDNAATL